MSQSKLPRVYRNLLCGSVFQEQAPSCVLVGVLTRERVAGACFRSKLLRVYWLEYLRFLFPNKHQILSAGHLFVQASPFKTLPGCRTYGRSILFNIFSGRKLLSWGAARKTASEKIGAKCEERKHFSPNFSLAVFRAMP